MSNLGSLYIEMGEPEGELDGCPCEVGDWAADEIVRQHNKIKKLETALLNISRTVDRIEVVEGVDDFGQLSIGCDLTAQLLTARNLCRDTLTLLADEK